jgi:glucose dehydrogenase
MRRLLMLALFLAALSALAAQGGLTRDNVTRLAPAWTYHTGEHGPAFATSKPTSFETTAARRLLGWQIPPEWGPPNLGGPIVTTGGVVFIGAALDRWLHSYDIETGRELWRGALRRARRRRPWRIASRPANSSSRCRLVEAQCGEQATMSWLSA